MTSALERGIIDAFASDATITGLISGRMYPVRLPDTARDFPAIVYQTISNPRQITQDGDSGTTFARVQLWLYARTYLECCTLRDAVVDFAKAHQTPPTTSFGSPAVLLAGWFVENEQDGDEPELEQSGVTLYWKRIDVTIHTNDL